MYERSMRGIGQHYHQRCHRDKEEELVGHLFGSYLGR